MKAAVAFQSELNDRKVQQIVLYGALNPRTAASQAYKLIYAYKVDVIIGTAGSPGARPYLALAVQMPVSNLIRKVMLEFRTAYQKANGILSSDAFSACSFGAWLFALDAASRTKGEPGTPTYRLALRTPS